MPGLRFCIETAFLLSEGMGEIAFGQLEQGQANILLVWRNHDGAVECGSPRATKVRFIFPNGIQVDADVPESRNMLPCNGQVQIWAFGPVLRPPTEPPALVKSGSRRSVALP